MRGSGEWVPADEHHRHRREDDDEYEDITDDEDQRVRRVDGDRGSRRQRAEPTILSGDDGREDGHGRVLSD